MPQFITTIRLDLHTDGEHVPYPTEENDLLGMTRTVGILAFLNDDFDNGVLEFPLQELSFKPNKGDILVFPGDTFSLTRFQHQVQIDTPYGLIFGKRVGIKGRT